MSQSFVYFMVSCYRIIQSLPDKDQGNLAETSPTKTLSAGAKKISVIEDCKSFRAAWLAHAAHYPSKGSAAEDVDRLLRLGG